MDVMNKCTFDKMLISRFLDGDLSETECVQVEAHCASCDQCRRVRGGYRAIGEALRAGGIEMGACVQGSSPQRRIVRVPLWSTGAKWAALFAATVALFTVIYLSATSSQQGTPIVIETESARIMNSPLGTLVYYEELAGKTVHSQFTRIATAEGSGYDESNTALKRISGYNSPLFRDSSVLERRYRAIGNGLYY
jgi:hypothetical protein